MKLTDKIETTCEDNMELMAGYSDNYFDLAIVDPPYGISINANMGLRKGKRKRQTFGYLFIPDHVSITRW